jgi:hypothetical protein
MLRLPSSLAPGLALLLALLTGAACGWRELAVREPAPTAPTWHVALDDSEPRRPLTIAYRTPSGVVATQAPSVRLVLADGIVHELPFVGAEPAGVGTRFRCAQVVPDHAVTVTVTPLAETVRVEIDDVVELPSELVELSIEFTLGAPAAGTATETFLPQEVRARHEVAGDVTWRLPAAFVRMGGHALAVLPDVTSVRPRLLPGALEARIADDAGHLRHGLLAQRVETSAHGVRCFRDPASARRIAGETITFAHEMRLWQDAQPQRTLHQVARALWQQLAAPAATQAGGALRPQVDRLLDARAGSGADQGEIRFGTGENAMLLAVALATRDDAAARDDARRLVQLALSAPMRSGLSPDVARKEKGKTTWSHSPSPGGKAVPAVLYDATAVAWTRTCALQATRHFSKDDELRVGAERAALDAARFLLANQQQSGAIPALYDTTYLAPEQRALYEPATECGAAALLLAECAALGTPDAGALRAGAFAAISYLHREVRPERAWRDRATLLGNPPEAAGRAHGRGTLGLVLAALASLHLSQGTDNADLHDATIAFIDDLTLQQQHWSPLWLAPDPGRAQLVGGFGRHDGDPQWSEPTQALAALAFLHGFEHLGRRDLLQRAASALRASLAPARSLEAGELRARSSHGMAAAVAQIAFARCGNVIVDVAEPFVESLDAVQVEFQGLALGEITLAALADPELVEHTRVSFRGLARSHETLHVLVHGRRSGPFRTEQLRQGIAIEPLPIPAFVAAPPRAIQADQPFCPRIRFAAPPPPGFAGKVILKAEAHDHEWPAALVPTDDPRTWQAARTLVATHWEVSRTEAASLPPGTAVRMRAELVGAQGQKATVVAAQPIFTADHTAIDLAGLDDSDLPPGNDCPRVLFADGARLARAVRHPATLTWLCRVPPSTLSLDLDVLAAGNLRLLANDSIVHEDRDEHAALPRWVRVKVSDKRLWEDGALSVTLVNTGPPASVLQVAELHTRIAGDTQVQEDAVPTPAAVSAVPDRTRAPDAQIAVLVVPVAVDGEPLTASHDQLQTLFFGDEYRRTPEPMSHATSGSVREILLAVSGGRTSLVGTVAEPAATPLSVGELARDPSQLATLLTPARADARYDVVVVVHSALDTPPIASELAGVAHGVAFIAERGSDRATLPVGTALASVLQARYGLPARSDPTLGNFGTLALTGHPQDHLPAAPLGLDLASAGWADVVHVDTPGEFAAAATQRGRRVLCLRNGLPGRGDLYLEARGGLPEEPGLPETGLLLYWQLRELPFVRSAAGPSVRPSLLRLSRQAGVTESPFVAGSAADLLQRAPVLDDSSAPVLATAQGELPFVLEAVGSTASARDSAVDHGVGERVGFSVRKLTRDLLQSPMQAQVQTGINAWTALPRDGVDRGLGTVHVHAGALRLMATTAPVRACIDAPSVAGRGQRVFCSARVQGGAARLHIGFGTTTALAADLASGSTERLVVDLPAVPDRHMLWLHVERNGASVCAVTFDELLAVPRARADHAPLRALRTQTARLLDGVIYGPLLPLTTSADARALLHEPVLIPAQRTMLRLRCGFAHDAPKDTTATLDVHLSSLDGKVTHALLSRHALRRGEGSQPLLTALLAIPESKAFVGVLKIAVHAAPATTLWFANVEVARP